MGLDSGTGNGKYLGLPADHPGKIWTIGLDRSQSLLNLARTAGGSDIIREVVRGDVLENGWRRGAFVRILCSCLACLVLMILQGLRNFNRNDTPSSDSRTPDSRREGLISRTSFAHFSNMQ